MATKRRDFIWMCLLVFDMGSTYCWAVWNSLCLCSFPLHFVWVCFRGLFKFMWNAADHSLTTVSGLEDRRKETERACLSVCSRYMLYTTENIFHCTFQNGCTVTVPWHICTSLWNQSNMETCPLFMSCTTYRSLSVTYFPYIADSWSAQPPSNVSLLWGVSFHGLQLTALADVQCCTTLLKSRRFAQGRKQKTLTMDLDMS